MINTGQFKTGQYIRMNGDIGQIRLFDNDLAVVDLETVGIKNFKPSELLQKYRNQELLFLSDSVNKTRYIDGITTFDIKEIKRRESYLVALAENPFPNKAGIREAVIQKVSKNISDKKPPRPSTLSTWYRKWIKSGKDTASQVIKSDCSRASRIRSEVLELMNEVIKEVYLTRSHPTISYSYHVFLYRYNGLNYPEQCPSLKTMNRVISKLNKLDVIAAREGRTQARTEARISNTKITVDFPLERVEIDTAHFNLGLLNNDGYYVGKPSIYFVIDVHSRAILGFAVHVGKAKESSSGVIHALTHAINVKDDPEYPMHGLMHTVVMDSGPGYRSVITKNFLSKISRTVEVAKTRSGWGKPFVERFIGTIRSRFFSTIDGYLGKYDPTKYSDDTLAKSAKHTVQDFHSWLYDYIVKEYHHTRHKGLKGKTPYAVWQHAIQFARPVLPKDIDELFLLRSLPQVRTLTRIHGVFFRYERFHSQELALLYDDIVKQPSTGKPIKVKITVLADLLDVRAITVVNPITGNLINVPNVDSQYVGKQSFAEINAHRNLADPTTTFPMMESNPIRIKVRNKKNKSGKEIGFITDEKLDADKLFETSHVIVEPEHMILQTSIASATLNNEDSEQEFDVD